MLKDLMPILQVICYPMQRKMPCIILKEEEGSKFKGSQIFRLLADILEHHIFNSNDTSNF